MSVELNEVKINEFANLIFRCVDMFGHLPISLRKEATPTKLEKYPRLLFGYLQRYQDPITAISEWQSKLMRDTPADEMNYKKEKYFVLLKELDNWVEQNIELFQGKNKKMFIQHLRGSLYARIFGYLYPRRNLVMSIVKSLVDHNKSIDYGIEHFNTILEQNADVQRLKQIVPTEEWQEVVADAKEKLLDSRKYYESIIKRQEETKGKENTNDL
ncbi:MAG TPA: hypothetical protein PKK61_06550 [Defluviitaleaceae bacterium]|nr:hypothetical protein [Defluviitaleaceae bacterium]